MSNSGACIHHDNATARAHSKLSMFSPSPLNPARQSHSHHTHLFAAASLREALNVGGSISEVHVESSAGQSNNSSTFPPSSTPPMDSTAARPAFGLEDRVRQSHSHQTHLFAAASLREALNVGGSVSEVHVGSSTGQSNTSSTFPPTPMDYCATPATGFSVGDLQPHSHETHLIAAASLREALNVGGSVSTDDSMVGRSLVPTLAADHQLPAPPPGLNFQTSPAESPSAEQIAALLESAAQTLTSVHATCLESSDFRDDAEPTSEPMATSSSSSSSSTRPGKVGKTGPPQRVPEEFSAPTFMEATPNNKRRSWLHGSHPTNRRSTSPDSSSLWSLVPSRPQLAPTWLSNPAVTAKSNPHQFICSVAEKLAP